LANSPLIKKDSYRNHEEEGDDEEDDDSNWWLIRMGMRV